MDISFSKRLLLVMNIIISFANASDSLSAKHNQQTNQDLIQVKLANLESSFSGKIGVYALNTGNDQIITYRGNERFPVQSTMKMIGVAALLKLSESNESILQEKAYYTKNELVGWTPITKLHLKEGMTYNDLAEAAVTYSDNTAINLIMKKLGGPKLLTDFARSIGNNSYNVTHYEADMNSNPNNLSDTSTPKDMATSAQKLMLGNTLDKSQQQQLITWMRNTVTGYKTIRASVPAGWAVADKTGSGDYGVRNDIGIIWSPSCKPIVLAIYTVGNKKEAQSRDDIVAKITSIVFEEFTKQDICLRN